jgi:hypothetical protein
MMTEGPSKFFLRVVKKDYDTYMRHWWSLALLASTICLAIVTIACGRSALAPGDGGSVGETSQNGDARTRNGDAEASGSDACPPPVEGDPCFADAAVCFLNSCCGIRWVCSDGQWTHALPCSCFP